MTQPFLEIMPKLPPEVEPADEAQPAKQRGIKAADFGYTLRVAPELEPLVKPMSDFRPHPRNLRRHNTDAIMASLDAYGQQSPIVVQKSTGFICKGNGTFLAAQMLGAGQIAASVEDFDDDTAWRYLLADNKTSDLASYDKALTVEALTELLEGTPAGLDNTLWNADDIDDLRAELGQIVVHEPDYVSASYAATEEQLAARAGAAARPGIKMKTTSVLLTVEQHDKFLANVQLLRKSYGTSGVIATIVEAVRREAERIGSEPAAPEPTSEELEARI